MSYLLLYGAGWTQRWRLVDDTADHVRAEITRVGRTETGSLSVVDPGSEEPTTLVIAWQHVAAAIVVGSDHEAARQDPSTGQYA